MPVVVVHVSVGIFHLTIIVAEKEGRHNALKVKPISLRVIIATWDSRIAGVIMEISHKDLELRTHLVDRLKSAGIGRVIERPAGRARVTIYAGRPGLSL